MDIVLKTKKGYSMLEMLICMCILTSMIILCVSNYGELNMDSYYFLNDYLLKQASALANKENSEINNEIYFNSMGHINQARTIEFPNHKIIIHLGTGYATLQ